MTRLSATERAERKTARSRLEAMSVKRMREFAKAHGLNLHGASTRLCIINTIMSQYEDWKDKA